MSNPTVLIFWCSMAGLVYGYVGYPIVVWCLSRWMGTRAGSHHGNANEAAFFPAVTVLIAAHNAEDHIQRRINNLRECDYPPERLRIVVASDGSTDATVARVRKTQDPNAEVIEYTQRRGKAMTLVAAVDSLRQERSPVERDDPIVLFTDATTRFERHSIARLVRHFAQPATGLVAGHVTILDQDGVPTESLYWKVEMLVRRCEASLGIMLGASGAIYAMRLRLFVPPSRPIINDDLVFPTLVHLQHGVGVVLDDTARAYATGGDGLAAEFRRRCRIGAGAIQCLPVLRDLFRWRNARTLLAFMSHKLLRWSSPALLVSALISNAILATEMFYRFTLCTQLLAYGLAMLGLFVSGNNVLVRIARVAASFVVMNLAIAVGVLRWMANPNNAVWKPTPRTRVDRNRPSSPLS